MLLRNVDIKILYVYISKMYILKPMSQFVVLNRIFKEINVVKSLLNYAKWNKFLESTIFLLKQSNIHAKNK